MNRHSIRFQNLNYAQPGFYFVTFCTQNRERLFEHDDVIDTINYIWRDLPNRFNDIVVDDWIVMPDHFHGIIVLGASNFDVGASTLGNVIGAFKSITTDAYIHGVKHHN